MPLPSWSIIAAAGKEVHPGRMGSVGSPERRTRTAERRRLVEAVRTGRAERLRVGSRSVEAAGRPFAVPSCVAERIGRAVLGIEPCPDQSELLPDAGVPLPLCESSPLPFSLPSTLCESP